MIFGEKCQGWKVQCTLSLPTGNSQEKHHLPRNKKKKFDYIVLLKDSLFL